MRTLIRKWFGRKAPEKIAEPAPNEIVVTGEEAIALGAMIFSGKRSGVFYVGEVATVRTNAYVDGAIVADKAVIRGRVNGNVVSLGAAIIRSSAIIEGDLTAQSVVMETGAILNGRLSVQDTVADSPLKEKVNYAANLLRNGYAVQTEEVEEEIELAEAVSAAPAPVQPKQKAVRPAALSSAADKPDEGGAAGGGWW